MAHFKVALLIETSTSWGRLIIRGIANYVSKVGDWTLFVEPRGRYEPLAVPADWQPHGIIARIPTPQLAEQIYNSRIPAVSVSWFQHDEFPIARCTGDEQSAGRTAAEHFLDRGFRNFAYVGPQNRPNYVDRFGQAFANALEPELTVNVFPGGGLFNQNPLSQAELVHWLQRLPKPVALLVFDSYGARQVLDACQQERIRVPEQIAVLAGEYDEVSCSLSRPAISYVNLAVERIGYEAAALLHRLMQADNSPRPVFIPPAGIVTQASTDTLAVSDPVLADAIQLIRDQSCHSLDVNDILDQVPISRRLLERRFREVIGRTPAAEIRRVRIERAKELLRTSDLSLEQISARCGFASGAVFSRCFRRLEGTVPSDYRRQFERPNG